MKTILIVDGICPRGLAIIQHLSASGEYHILVFTKNTTCPGAAAINAILGVTLLLNRASTGYDLCTFSAAAQRCPSILICSSAANSEGKEGVQWGTRLVQAAAQAGAKHVVFLSMEPERKQCSTDNFIHTLPKSPMSWTIIRSTVDTPSCQQTLTGSERCLSTSHLRNLAHYVTWVFAHPERSSGLDFSLPMVTATACGSVSSNPAPKRRDSRATTSGYQVEGIQPHPASGGLKGTHAKRSESSRVVAGGEKAVYLDDGRNRAIREWVAKTTPEVERESEGEEDEDEDEDEDEEDDGESGEESD